MARNKYPEETVKKILDAAEELFMTRGYEQTTMQDIVDRLGGLTKGAVYHHFKSKEDILMAVFERANRPMVAHIEKVTADCGLTGLEKLRAFDDISSGSPALDMWRTMRPSSDPVHNARVFAQEYHDALDTAHTYIEPAIREGIADGSIETEHPREVAEVMLLLANLWMVPLFNPVASVEEYRRRAEVFLRVMHALGIDLVSWDSLDSVRMWSENWDALANGDAGGERDGGGLRAAGEEGPPEP